MYTFVMDTRDTIHTDAMGDVTGSQASARGIVRIHVTIHPESNALNVFNIQHNSPEIDSM
jgi:hypothetical protein